MKNFSAMPVDEEYEVLLVITFPSYVVFNPLVCKFLDVVTEGSFVLCIFVPEREGVVIILFFESCVCHSNVIFLFIVDCSCHCSLVHYALFITLPS